MNETYTITPHLLLELPELVAAWSTVSASRENPLVIFWLSRINPKNVVLIAFSVSSIRTTLLLFRCLRYAREGFVSDFYTPPFSFTKIRFEKKDSVNAVYAILKTRL